MANRSLTPDTAFVTSRTAQMQMKEKKNIFVCGLLFSLTLTISINLIESFLIAFTLNGDINDQ